MSRVILATDDAHFEARVRTALGEPNGSLRRLGTELLGLHVGQAADLLTTDPAFTPDVIAIGPAVDEAHALELAQALDGRPGLEVVLVAPPLQALYQQAMHCGVRDIVAPDASVDELRAAFERAQRSAARSRPAAGDGRPRRVITVVSPKGGAGKTMLSTHLATGLAERGHGEVVLADYDLQFGDVSSALRLIPEQSLTDIAGSQDALGVKAALTPHASGLYVLAAPDDPIDSERITPEQARDIAALLSSEFETVVVDTCAGLTDHTLAALEVTTDIVLLCTMDVPSVRSLRKVVVALDAIGMTEARRHFVVNRTQSRVGLEEDDIALTVGMPIDHAIPSTRGIPLAMNQGQPITATDPRNPAARQLTQLIDRFSPQPAKSSKGILGRRR